MPAPAAAVDRQDIWKDAEMRHFAVALICHALRRLNANENTFTTDVVGDSERFVNGRRLGPGVPGSVLTKLQNAHVVRPVGIFSDGVFYQHRAKSTREDAKTRFVNVYELTSREAAQEFLRRNQTAVEQPQMELTMTIETPRQIRRD